MYVFSHGSSLFYLLIGDASLDPKCTGGTAWPTFSKPPCPTYTALSSISSSASDHSTTCTRTICVDKVSPCGQKYGGCAYVNFVVILVWGTTLIMCDLVSIPNALGALGCQRLQLHHVLLPPQSALLLHVLGPSVLTISTNAECGTVVACLCPRSVPPSVSNMLTSFDQP